MKKSLVMIATLIMLLVIITLPASAAAESVAPDMESAETTSSHQVNEESKKEEPQHTVVSRVWEYYLANQEKILGLAGDAAIFALALLIKVRYDKKTTALAENLVNVKQNVEKTNSSQDTVSTSMDRLSAGYIAMKESYDQYGLTENDRNRVIGALVAQNTAILDILATVYTNSKNLPQGAKDLVTLKYANCLKALEDDAELRAIVLAVRDNISAGSMDVVEETES